MGMLRIKEVKVVENYVVDLELTNGEAKRVDLEPFFRGSVFEEIRNDYDEFLKISVDPLMGTIFWPNGADIDPDVLIHDLRPASWTEEKELEVA